MPVRLYKAPAVSDRPLGRNRKARETGEARMTTSLGDRNPIVFDALVKNQGRIWDLEFYRNLVLTWGAPIVELGSGTGRILLHLLLQGVDAVGIERDRAMGAYCRQRLRSLLGGASMEKVLIGDVRDLLPTVGRSKVIAPYNFLCAVHSLDEIGCLLEAIESSGHNCALAFDIYVAERMPWGRGDAEWRREFNLPLEAEYVSVREHSHYSMKTNLLTIDRYVYWPDGMEYSEEILLKMWAPTTIKKLFTSRGWSEALECPLGPPPPLADASKVYCSIWNFIPRGIRLK